MSWKGQFGVSPEAKRLEALIEQRSSQGADQTAIDAKIWEEFGATYTVMFTDLAGFSRKVAQFGILHFLQTIHQSHRLLFPIVAECGGELLKIEGDSLLILFAQPKSALVAAQRMQDALEEFLQNRPKEEWILLCIGIGHGRVLRVGKDDVFGAEVNAAAKLGEDMAKSGEILVTDGFAQAAGIAPEFLEPLDKAPSGAEKAWRIVGDRQSLLLPAL